MDHSSTQPVPYASAPLGPALQVRRAERQALAAAERACRLAARALEAPMCLALLRRGETEHLVLHGIVRSADSDALAAAASAALALAGDRPVVLTPDDRFWPHAIGLRLAACLAVPLVDAAGAQAGALAVFDRRARSWGAEATRDLLDVGAVLGSALPVGLAQARDGATPAAALPRTTGDQAAQPLEAADAPIDGELLRQLFDTLPLPAGIVELPDDNHDVFHLYDNPAACETLGVPRGSTIGRWAHAGIGVPADRVHAWIGPFREAERSGRPVSFVRQRSGQSPARSFAITVTFVCRPLGGRSRFSYVLEDITEQLETQHVVRHQQQAMREAEQRKDRFLAVLGHELRNPLAPLRNAARLLRGTVLAQERRDWAAEVIERQVGQMVRLIDDLLDVARIASDRLELRRQRCDLLDAIRQAVETSQPLIEQREHTLELSLHEEALPVDGDPARLAQVFANLLNNAANYTQRGGLIELSAAHEGAVAVVRVRDNGVGIAADKRARLFELFAQLDGAHEGARDGMGIGLSLARRLVELHGGTIAAESAGPGMGSEFVVRLPLLAS